MILNILNYFEKHKEKVLASEFKDRFDVEFNLLREENPAYKKLNYIDTYCYAARYVLKFALKDL